MFCYQITNSPQEVAESKYDFSCLLAASFILCPYKGIKKSLQAVLADFQFSRVRTLCELFSYYCRSRIS